MSDDSMRPWARRGAFSVGFAELRLDGVAALVEALRPCAGDGGTCEVLGSVASILRTLGERWDEIDRRRPFDRRYRWDELPLLADACVALAVLAAKRRGHELRAAVRVADRLRDAARFLIDVGADRTEVVAGALDLAWVAGAIPACEPPDDDHDLDAVIDALVTGVALVATVADLDHPRAYYEWRAMRAN